MTHLFYESYRWEDWLYALYQTGEVCLADFAIEQGWEELVLREYYSESKQMGDIQLSEDSPEEDWRREIDRDFVHIRRAALLFSCLKYCYPTCPHCEGYGFPKGSNWECDHCHRGLLLPKEVP